MIATIDILLRVVGKQNAIKLTTMPYGPLVCDVGLVKESDIHVLYAALYYQERKGEWRWRQGEEEREMEGERG